MNQPATVMTSPRQSAFRFAPTRRRAPTVAGLGDALLSGDFLCAGAHLTLAAIDQGQERGRRFWSVMSLSKGGGPFSRRRSTLDPLAGHFGQGLPFFQGGRTGALKDERQLRLIRHAVTVFGNTSLGAVTVVTTPVATLTLSPGLGPWVLPFWPWARDPRPSGGPFSSRASILQSTAPCDGPRVPCALNPSRY
jgi:hypothetical protein